MSAQIHHWLALGHTLVALLLLSDMLVSIYAPEVVIEKFGERHRRYTGWDNPQIFPMLGGIFMLCSGTLAEVSAIDALAWPYRLFVGVVALVALLKFLSESGKSKVIFAVIATVESAALWASFGF